MSVSTQREAPLKSLENLAGFLSGVHASPAQLEDVRSFFGYLRASHNGVEILPWYEILFEFAPQGYIVTDKDGVIRDANATAVEMLGIDLVSLVGAPLKMILPDENMTFYLFAEEEASPAARISRFDVTLTFPAKRPFMLRGCVTQVFDAQSRSLCFLWLIDTDRRTPAAWA